MRQIMVLSFATCMLVACTANKTEAPVTKGTGYTADETDNVKIVKQANEAAVKFDTAALRSFYSSGTDTIHNNLESATVDQNIAMLADYQKQGVSFSIGEYYAIWESISYKPNDKGVSNYVISYCTLNAKKGDKSVTVLYNQVCAFKGNKMVEEWDVWDTKGMDEIFK